MIGVDTNILVRLFVADDELQTARAVRLMRDAEAVFVPKTVVLELAWVLAAVYGLPRARVGKVLATLAGLERVQLEDRPTVERAIALFEEGLEDFADALHLCSWVSVSEFATFDRKLITRARKLRPGTVVRLP